MNMQTSDSIVIIPPTMNGKTIENIIRAVFALEHGFHILVIEDGSPDGTAAIVKDLQREFPHRLFMVERKGKTGRWYADSRSRACNGELQYIIRNE